MQTEIVPSVLKNIPLYAREQSPTAAGHTAPLHLHDEIEFIQIISGRFCCTVLGNTYELLRGDIILINERIPHSTVNLEDGTNTQVVQFDPGHFSNERLKETCRYLSRFINIDKTPATVFEANLPLTRELSGYLDTILHEFACQNAGFELYIKANIISILALLSRADLLTDSSELFNESIASKILPALIYIDDHYCEHITLEEISGVLNLSSSYFCRLFKQATNSTFLEYVNFVRVCKAERLLMTRHNSISKIALDIGFSSVTYFNRIFKRFKGCTPTEYKKSKYSR